MGLIKFPYELSVWQEKMVDGKQKEYMSAIIGAHDMSFLGKATSPVLVRHINGTSSLSFSMPSKYFDSQLGEYVHNNLVDLIKSESKIKLFYKEKWYEFLVKKITENKKFKAIMYNYSCQDSFIDELSRNGYDIVFDPSINNSVEELGIFTEEVLNDSAWDYDPSYNIGDFTEYKEQRFYKIPVKQFERPLYGYLVNLEIDYSMFLDEKQVPRKSFEEYLKKKNIDWEKESEKNSLIDRINEILTIHNVLTEKERVLEFGDDLARELSVYWDSYFEDNGSPLIHDDNKVLIESDYIYVPINDLSTIVGGIYKDEKNAVESPALFGEYPDTSKGYALQPTSKNPRELIQFLSFKNGEDVLIDEENTIINKDCHYIIPIEEWNDLLSCDSTIYWTEAYSNVLPKNEKYDTAIDGENIYTVNVTPRTSTIDDFDWNPVYFEGYDILINDISVSQMRKISVTDRTEYNKNSDIYVKVYNNKATDYIKEGEEKYSLVSNKELSDLLDKGELFRVTSKLKTRQILPELARNMVENGTNITSTNGWEAKTQNCNNKDLLGIGANMDLLQMTVQSTVGRNASEQDLKSDAVRYQDYLINGAFNNEEGIKNYYLEILSPVINKTEDFSLEGHIEKDYALNMGIISQDKKIEKDKVYAIQIITGTRKPAGVLLKYRNSNAEPNKEYFDNTVLEDNKTAFEVATDGYKDTLWLYKKILDLFKEDSVEDFQLKEKELLGTENLFKEEAELFYEIINRWAIAGDKNIVRKINRADKLLKVILFGEKDISERGIWTTNITEYEEESLIQTPYQGVIKKYDDYKSSTKNYEKMSFIGISPLFNEVKDSYAYTNSDVQFLRTYLYEHIGEMEG